MTTKTYITDEQIEALQIEAGAAGDTEMVGICKQALSGLPGSPAARRVCADAIDAARAMDGESA